MRLRIAEGSPWREALLCALEPYAPYPPGTVSTTSSPATSPW